jgi:hypothetical protein
VVRVHNDVYVGLPHLSLRLLLCWWVGVEAPVECVVRRGL